MCRCWIVGRCGGVAVRVAGTYRERVRERGAEGAEAAAGVRGRAGRRAAARPVHGVCGVRRGGHSPSTAAAAHNAPSRYINLAACPLPAPTCLLSLRFGITCKPQQ